MSRKYLLKHDALQSDESDQGNWNKPKHAIAQKLSPTSKINTRNFNGAAFEGAVLSVTGWPKKFFTTHLEKEVVISF